MSFSEFPLCVSVFRFVLDFQNVSCSSFRVGGHLCFEIRLLFCFSLLGNRDVSVFLGFFEFSVLLF